MIPALQISHLTVNYGENPALWDVTLSIPQGHVIGIIGPNGAGKTTLIKSVLELIPKLSGKVQFLGLPLNQSRQRVAYVPQKESVDWDFPVTVFDLVLMGRYGKLGLCRRPKEADRKAVWHVLDLVGMKHLSNRQISELSGGQQQRAFFARALMQDAEIYFMDEPFSGIDLATRSLIMDLLHQMKKKGKTIFVVHHELASVEAYFDTVVMLNIRLVAAGPVKETFTSENLYLTYGKSYALLDEALKISQQKEIGLG
jgi:manganese/zinc/iron transport system ATP- binding protein